jgi:DNA polymerase III alpha subunit
VSGFVHLHCHSVWSLLDGAIPAEALPHAAAALGFEAVALTDHDSLLGAVRFARACRDAGVKPVYGAELTVNRDGHLEHVTVIVRNATGYGNLCRLITAAHLGNERGHPSVTPEALAEHAEGLFVLSGCRRGEVARLAAAGAVSPARGAGGPGGGARRPPAPRRRARRAGGAPRSATATASRSSTTAATAIACCGIDCSGSPRPPACRR